MSIDVRKWNILCLFTKELHGSLWFMPLIMGTCKIGRITDFGHANRPYK